MMDSNTAMVVVLGITGYKVLDHVVAFFFRKLTKDDYVTKKECEGCEKQKDSSLDKITSEISTIKGLLLVLAVKNEIPPEQLAKLTN